MQQLKFSFVNLRRNLWFIDKVLLFAASPSPELVERVRDLYRKRVSDVRFLIPVLIGLTKEEVVDALPKLIKLNPVVVKEVFNRLLQGPGRYDSHLFISMLCHQIAQVYCIR